MARFSDRAYAAIAIYGVMGSRSTVLKHVML